MFSANLSRMMLFVFAAVLAVEGAWGSTLNYTSVTMVDFDPVGGWVPTGQPGRIKNQRERVYRQLHQDRALAQRSVRKRQTGRTGARATPQMWTVSERFP